MTEHTSSEQDTATEFNIQDINATVGFINKEKDRLATSFLPLFNDKLKASGKEASEADPDELVDLQIRAFREALSVCSDEDYELVNDFLLEASTTERIFQRSALLASGLFNELAKSNGSEDEGAHRPGAAQENSEDYPAYNEKTKKELKQEKALLEKSLDKQWAKVAKSGLEGHRLDAAVDAFRDLKHNSATGAFEWSKKKLKKSDASVVISGLLRDIDDPKEKTKLRAIYTDFFESGVWQSESLFNDAKNDYEALVALEGELRATNKIKSTERKWRARRYVILVGGLATAAAGIIGFVKYGTELGGALDTLFSSDTSNSVDISPSATDTSGPTTPETTTSAVAPETHTPAHTTTETPPPTPDTGDHTPGNSDVHNPTANDAPTSETRVVESGDTFTKYAHEIADSHGLDANDGVVVDKIADALVDQNGGEDIFAGQTVDITEGNKAAESIILENATPEPTRIEQLVDAGISEDQAKQFEKLPAGAGGFQIMEMMNVDPALIDSEHWDIVSKGLPEAYPNDFEYVTTTNPDTGVKFEEVRLMRTELSPEGLAELLRRIANL